MNMRFACSIRDRLRGLLGKRKRNDDCFGKKHLVRLSLGCYRHSMSYESGLAIGILSPAGVVLESRRAVGPRRRIRCRQAALTLERFADNTPWYKPGDHVQLEDPRRNP